ncbi:hypothetical protein [Tianweitania sp.]|uniref:DUF7662 domain-containing protein n=1 Tax=Tianweitania sp. TaxID=2021634 RepID=UPI00289D26CB|nr:hypothetical protein [Tianweitania sp.]
MRQSADRVVMTFDELADLVASMPSSARIYAAWWNNEDVDTTNHVQCKAWQAAGYLADADLKHGVVTFRRGKR